MSKSKYRISQEVKDQILDRIKNQGVSVPKAAEEHGISTKTIYNWLAKGVTAQPSVLELARLKRENKALLELVGRITLELNDTKKKN